MQIPTSTGEHSHRIMKINKVVALSKKVRWCILLYCFGNRTFAFMKQILKWILH